jgi:hypothetical protein
VDKRVDRAHVENDWKSRGFSCGLWTDPPEQVWENYTHDVDELLMILEGELELEITEEHSNRSLAKKSSFSPRDSHGSQCRRHDGPLALRLQRLICPARTQTRASCVPRSPHAHYNTSSARSPG